MQELTLTQINDYLDGVPDSFDVIINDNLCVNIKTFLTESERKHFVDRVVENSYVDGFKYSSVYNRIAFIDTFAQMLTNLPISYYKDNPDMVDTEKLCGIVVKMGLINKACSTSRILNNLIEELKTCIKEDIDFKNQEYFAACAALYQNNEAIDAVIQLTHKGTDGANKLCDILSNIEDLTRDGKFLKLIPKKKMDAFLDKVQKIIDGIIVMLKRGIFSSAGKSEM